MISRRHFIASASMTGIGLVVDHGSSAQEAASTTSLSTGPGLLATMPMDFTGLSYEIVQLYNPDFFSSTNTKLVQIFRNLSSQGVLRVGGNLSDLSRWNGVSGDFSTPKQSAAIERGKLYWEWKLTDTTVRSNRDGAITPAAIRNLRTFLDATGWRLIYGLNFGSGSPARAADEAACVATEIGNRLLAFQIGNEADFFGGNKLFRERPFAFPQYDEGILDFISAIRKRVPHARFGGPDTASNMDWVERFGMAQKTLPAAEKAPLLSSHYYAMGPASDPAMNAERLLAPNSKLLGQIAAAQHATADSGGIPFRMTEGNSCFGGGKPGVSDSFCSALWVADYMLQLASTGYAGVNLHGGGDGFYTPVASLEAAAPAPRPMYLGMQLAERFAGLTFVPSIIASSENLTAYSAKGNRLFRQVLINKSGKTVNVLLGRGIPRGNPSDTYLLSAPSLASQTEASFLAVPPNSSEVLTIQPYSAILQSWIV